jgi:soluble lytic murein transglycosylase-like protein
MGGAGFRADPALTLLATVALGAALLLAPAVQWPASQPAAVVAQPTITVRPFPTVGTGEAQSIVFLAAATHADDAPVAAGSQAPAPEPEAEPLEPAELAELAEPPEPPEPPEATEAPTAPAATPTPNRRPLPRRDYAVPVARIVGGWPFGPSVYRWQPMVDAALATVRQQRRLDPVITPELVLAMIAAESNGDPLAVSHANAIGLLQVLPGTFAGYFGDADPFDPDLNLRAGIIHLQVALLGHGGDLEWALAAYNAGLTYSLNARLGNDDLWNETVDYVMLVMDLRERALRFSGVPPPPPPLPFAQRLPTRETATALALLTTTATPTLGPGPEDAAAPETATPLAPPADASSATATTPPAATAATSPTRTPSPPTPPLTPVIPAATTTSRPPAPAPGLPTPQAAPTHAAPGPGLQLSPTGPAAGATSSPSRLPATGTAGTTSTAVRSTNEPIATPATATASTAAVPTAAPAAATAGATAAPTATRNDTRR